MNNRWQAYRQATGPLPDRILSWLFFGAGLENFGENGRPTEEPRPTCGPDEILVRVDALGLCASDAKMVRMAGDYPLFFERDFAADPARLGHEAALTVIEVGRRWQDQYRPGQRLGIQPDVYVNGERVIFGVNIPGGMTQYLTLDEQVLAGDGGSYVFPVPPELSYADVALLEPWACVEVAYSVARRLEPKPGGVMWIKGRPGDTQSYLMSRALGSAQVILTDAPASLATWVHSRPVEVIERNGADPLQLVEEFAARAGFDDIILLDPKQADLVARAADCLAARGALNLVTAAPLDGPVPVDVGRLHYEHQAYLGCPGPDIGRAYGVDRNRSDLRPGGVAWIVGAGGTMGRMNLQRALEMEAGPQAVIATNRGEARLASLVEDFGPLAQARGKELVAISPEKEPDRLRREIDRLTGSRGCDDIVAVVPDTGVMESVLPHLAPDGMLVLFAGVPTGSKIPLPLDHVSLHQAQFTGTSGSTVADQLQLLQKIQAGRLSPARSVAAIGGLKAMAHGMQAVLERRYPGKIVIFPQLLDLPLLSLAELKQSLPEVTANLAPDGSWTDRAEQALFERYL